METTFATWLRQRRKELGVAQEELAERIGCSAIMLRKLESGQRHPSSQVAQLLADYLGIPAGEREAFIAFARTGKILTPESSASRAPWRPPSPGQSSRTNLPAPLTSFIGRERDLDKAVTYLLGPSLRLLTLTGAPGIGKTRLAMEVASRVAPHFEHGVFLVELATLADPDLVLPTIAQVLGLKETGGSGVAELLVEHLRERSLLLVLDNFEQVLDAAAGVVKLLERSPRLKVLVTSREALHVRGEHRLPVPPLELPNTSIADSGAGSSQQQGSPQLRSLAECASVELFVDRARSVVPDFTLTMENAGDIADICTRLEGLPLAIELAAARADYFSPGDMRAALNSRLKLLTGGARDLPLRQRTLKSAIEWSYDLLTVSEQKVLRPLSVFAGGFSLEAAQAVCDSFEDVGDDISNVLEALVDKHLLRELNSGGRADMLQGESRFGMLEMIREYANEKLWASEEIGPEDVEEEAEVIGRAHALYFTDFAEKAVSKLQGPEGASWLNRLEVEHDNVRAALRWLLDRATDDAESSTLALRLAAAMGPFWRSRGYFSEGQEWLSQVLTDEESVERNAGGQIKSLRARALDSAGWLAWFRGDLAAAHTFFTRGLALYREVGERQGIAHLLNGLAQLALDRLSYEEAIAAYQEALAIARQVKDNSLVARTLNNLGNTYRNMTNYPAALRCYEESLGLYRAMQDFATMITPMNNLGLISTDLEDYAAAHRYYGEALHLCRVVGNREALAFTLAFVGMQAVEEGDFDKARQIYAEALPLVRDLGYKLVLALCLEGVALMQQKAGHPLVAAKLWGRAASIRDEMEIPLPVPSRPRYERNVDSARSQADPTAFATAWAEGGVMPTDEAVRYALEAGRV